MSREAALPTATPRHLGPSLRDLAGLVGSEVDPLGGRALFQHLGLLVDLQAGDEVMSAGCGTGQGLELLVRAFGVHGSGVDTDGRAVLAAEERARQGGLEEQLRVQSAPMDALPYRDGIFDVSVGELGLTAGASAEGAVSELARVTRPGGAVVLVQLAWTAPVTEAKQQEITKLLGFSPRPLVEWKRLMMGNGIQRLYAEDWSEGSNALRSGSSRPVPGLTSKFSLRERLDVTRRAWKRWGFRGARGCVGRGWPPPTPARPRARSAADHSQGDAGGDLSGSNGACGRSGHIGHRAQKLRRLGSSALRQRNTNRP